jgi:hypothetical protein
MKAPTLTPAQLATLKNLLRRFGGNRERVATLLHTTPATIDCIEIGRVRRATFDRVAAALDEIARGST